MIRVPAALLIAALAVPVHAVPVHADDITVFAAASMKNALDRIGADYEAASGDKVLISYAGSSALAKQIEAGAPADIFISASTDWMDVLGKSGAIDAASRKDLLGNTLVLISHEPGAPIEMNSDTDLHAMLGGGKLAMALVDSVPAGVYGKQALSSLGLWDSVSADVAQADNVRAALALVATGEAPLGIVYATDAKAEPKVSRIATFPADSHAPITYPAALTATAKAPAQAFLDALSSPEAAQVFESEGFSVLK